jgi:hypothetical protein
VRLGLWNGCHQWAKTIARPGCSDDPDRGLGLVRFNAGGQANAIARGQSIRTCAVRRSQGRGSLEAKLSGDPGPTNLYEDWMRVVEFQQDMDTPPVDEVDSIVRNHSVNRDSMMFDSCTAAGTGLARRHGAHLPQPTGTRDALVRRQ